MKTVFKSSFTKDLKAIKKKTVLESVAKLIEAVEAAQNLRAIPDVKKLKSKGDYYRIKLGDYRVGITLNKDEITFVRCLDRKRDLQVFSLITRPPNKTLQPPNRAQRVSRVEMASSRGLRLNVELAEPK